MKIDWFKIVVLALLVINIVLYFDLQIRVDNTQSSVTQARLALSNEHYNHEQALDIILLNQATLQGDIATACLDS